MQRLRSFLRPRPKPIAIRSTDPLALYLGGDGRMQAVKASGFISSNSMGRVGMGYVLAHAEEYVKAAISSVWAANCINLRADSVSRLDFYVRERKSQERVAEHPFEFALANSQQNIIRKLERSQLVHGETFIKPLYNDSQFYSAMWVLNNLDVEVDTTQGHIRQFMYTPQGYGKTKYYRPDEIGFIYTDNDYDDLRGLSKFEHILLEIHIDRDISRTTAAFYQNDARPGILLLVEQDLTSEQAEEFVEYWNAQLQGPANAGRTIMVPKVIREVVDFQRAPTIDDVELRESTRREICAAFKVPLSMAGAWDDATYQSLPEQRKFFYEETVIPEAENLAREMTKKVLPFFEPDNDHYEVYFDARNILALIENATEKTDIAVKKLSSGAYTINEFREFHEDEPIEGGDIHLMQSGWIPVHTRELATFEAPNVAMPETPMLPEPTTPPTQTRHAQKQGVDRPAYAYIPLANNLDVLRIQRSLKERYTDDRIQWEAAPTLHVTLCYADKIGDTAIPDFAEMIHVQQMELTGAFLDVFDTPDGKALHIRLENSSVLSDVQASVYAAFKAKGDGLSEYSLPANYKPHITMGYLPNDISFESETVTLSILADCVQIGRDDYDPVLTLQAPKYIKHNHDIIRYETVDTVEVKTIHAEALAELRAWQKFMANGTGQKRTFTARMIRDELAEHIQSQLQTADNLEAIKAIFRDAEAQIRIKAVTQVEANFISAFMSLLEGQQAGRVTARSFEQALYDGLRTHGRDAYRAGLTDGGVIISPSEDNFGTEDNSNFELIYASQAQHVRSFVESLYGETLSAAQRAVKPQQWFGKSILPFYDGGLLSAARNQMVEFVGPITGTSCDSCKTLVGQRHRRMDFAQAGLTPPYGSRIICGDGGLCKHRLIPINGRERGDLFGVPKR